MKKVFSLAEAFRFGFYNLIEHFAFFLALMFSFLGVFFIGCFTIFALFAIPFFPKILKIVNVLDAVHVDRNEMAFKVMKYLGGQATIFIIIAFFLIYLLNRYLTLGFTKACLEIYDHDQSTIKTLFSCYPLILKSTIASFLYWLMCSVGFMFFVFPGIYFAIAFGFFNQFIIDKNVGALEALQLSFALTEGVKWHLFALWFLLILINALAISIFGLSFFITWPLSSLTYVYAYRKLQGL